MRTTRELRQQNHLPIPSNPDSEYKPVVRVEKAPAPIHIRHKLQKELPFKLQEKTSEMVKQRKKQKLEGKTRLMELLDKYRAEGK